MSKYSSHKEEANIEILSVVAPNELSVTLTFPILSPETRYYFIAYLET